MHRKDAIAWVATVCAATLRLSQAKTLGILVGAAMRVQRVSLANIGRMMEGCAKYQIKRCWRFCANQRVETADAMRPFLYRLLKKRSREKKLLIALDWVDIKGFQTLVASIVLKGRGTPVAWASTTNHVYDGHRSRNAFEESLLLVLRDMIPERVKVVILADRGFGRTALATFCQQQDFGYVIRIQPKVTVRLYGFHGKLLDYPVYKGIANHFKKFITPLPAGPWRGQAYVELIDLFLEEVLDLNEAGKYAELARASLPAALAEAKAGDSWKAIAYDVQLRVGLVSFCQNKGTVAAEAFEEARKLAPSKQAGQSLEALIAAAKMAKAVVPEDVKGDGKGKDNDKVALALSISVIYTVAGRYDDAQTFLDRVCGVPAVATKPPTPARPPMSGASQAQLAFGIFMKGAMLQAKGNRDAAKEQFLASLKTFDAGTWHDETLYRTASTAQEDAERQHAKSDDGKVDPGEQKPLSDKEREAKEKAEKEQKAGLVKAKTAALPYWQELFKRYSATDKDGKLTPKSPRLEVGLYNIGVILCEMAEVAPEDKLEQAWREAEAALRRFCETYPKSPLAGDAYCRLIDIALEQTFSLATAGTFGEAAIQWVSAVSDSKTVEPTSSDVWRLGGRRNADVKAAAYELCRRAGLVAYLSQKNEQAAELLQRGGQYDTSDRKSMGAETALQRMIAIAQRKTKPLTPEDLLAQLTEDKQRTGIVLADLYLMTFDPYKAGALYQRLLKGERPFPRPEVGVEAYLLLRLGQTMEFQKKHEEAMACLQRLYEKKYAKFPWVADGIFRLGTWVQNAGGDSEEAMNHWAHVYKNFPTHPEAERSLFYLGLTAVYNKQYAKAVDAFREYLGRYPDGPSAKRVRERELPQAEQMLKGEVK